MKHEASGIIISFLSEIRAVTFKSCYNQQLYTRHVSLLLQQMNMLSFSFVKKQNGKNIVEKFRVVHTSALAVWSPVDFQQHWLYGRPRGVSI